MRQLPSQETLRQFFDYDPATGILRWHSRPREQFASTAAWKGWNTKYAGTATGRPRRDAGYPQVSIDNRSWRAHRIVWKWMTGSDPAWIDHRDNDRGNLIWSNLRETTPVGNLGNMRVRVQGTLSGLKGACPMSASNRFGARIRIDGRVRWLGTFATAEEAHAAYCVAAREHFGEFWNPGTRLPVAGQLAAAPSDAVATRVRAHRRDGRGR